MNAVRETGINHYPRHVGDFIRDTVGLTLVERGAYTALLDQYYASEKPLPIEQQEHYRMTGAVTKVERAAVDYVIKRYFKEQPDGWHQKRCDIELAKQSERSTSARESAERMWSKRNANAMPTHSEGNASQKPVANSQRSKAKPTAPPDLPVDLELWQHFRESRQAMRAPLTDRAAALLVNKLRDLAAAGNDPTKVVEQSIERGWKGFFAVDQDRPKSAPTLTEKRVANMDELTGRNRARSDSRVMDGTPVRPLVSDLRQSDDDDVGRLSKG